MSTLTFWFSAFPPELATWTLWFWLLIAGMCVLIGSVMLPREVVRVAQKKFQRKFHAFERAPISRIEHLLTTTGLLLFLLLFFRVEGIPALSARWLIVLVIVIDLVWLAFIVRHIRTRVPEQRRAMEERKRKERYLP